MPKMYVIISIIVEFSHVIFTNLKYYLKYRLVI